MYHQVVSLSFSPRQPISVFSSQNSLLAVALYFYRNILGILPLLGLYDHERYTGHLY